MKNVNLSLISCFVAGCGAATTGPIGSSDADASAGAIAGPGGTSGGNGANLPRCELTSKPLDPVMDGGWGDASPNEAGRFVCNSVTPTGAWLDWEAFRPSNGGIALSNGALERPLGGDLVDGDYNLVRFRENDTVRTRNRRSIRLFNHGTYFEWGIDVDSENDSFSVTANSSMHSAGTPVVQVDNVDCTTITFNTSSYGYTAQGDLLSLYFYDPTVPGPSAEIQTAYTYQRLCSR